MLCSKKVQNYQFQLELAIVHLSLSFEIILSGIILNSVPLCYGPTLSGYSDIYHRRYLRRAPSYQALIAW